MAKMYNFSTPRNTQYTNNVRLSCPYDRFQPNNNEKK